MYFIACIALLLLQFETMEMRQCKYCIIDECNDNARKVGKGMDRLLLLITVISLTICPECKADTYLSNLVKDCMYVIYLMYLVCICTVTYKSKHGKAQQFKTFYADNNFQMSYVHQSVICILVLTLRQKWLYVIK